MLLAALDDFQTAVQAFVNAKSSAAEGLANYNISLARLEEAKGTSLERWRIQFEAGHSPIPPEMSPYSSYRAIGHQNSMPAAGHSTMEYRRNSRRSGYHQNSVRK